MLTMNVADLDPLYPENSRQKQWEYVKNEKIVVFQSQHRTKDGKIFPVEITSNYLRFNDTEYEFAFATDITSRKKAEEDLRQSETRYRTITERSFDVIFILGTDGKIEYVSPSVEPFLNYTPDDISGKNFAEFISVEDIDSIYEMVNDVLKGHEIREKLAHVHRKDGTTILVEFNATPIRENDIIIGIQGNARDVTERYRLQQEREAHLQKMLSVSKSVIDTLAMTVEKRDPYTAGHQRRVAQLAIEIAREMGLPENSIEALSMAGVIHDIGKIYIPSEILSKPGKLSSAEFNMVKVHPQAGYEILKNIDFPWPIAEIVHQHHERLDGSGYPQGLKAEEILLEAKILMVADVFEAMVSHRPYRPALGLEAALNELAENKGVLYDKKIVDISRELITNKGFTFQ